MFTVAVRSKRHSEYLAYSQFDHYGQARIEQITQRARHYDAQIFSGEPFDRTTLVYAPPKAQHLINPYDRLEALFQELCDEGSFRCLVARPSATVGLTDHRLYLYSFTRRLNYIDSTVYAVDLRRDANIIVPYHISYCPHDDPPYRFEDGLPIRQELRAGRMEGVYIADVAEQFNLYFGYVESPSEDQIVEQVRIDTKTLYEL